MAKNPVRDFQVSAEDIHFIGHDLQRPECILAERDGTLWTADARGGVVKIAPDGGQTLVTQNHGNAFATARDDAERFTQGTLPNGLAFAQGGDILIANFGTDVPEVMDRSGTTRVLYDSIDGQAIGKVNFVLRDSQNRVWLTVSTRIKNWIQAISPKSPTATSPWSTSAAFALWPTAFGSRTRSVWTRTKSFSILWR